MKNTFQFLQEEGVAENEVIGENGATMTYWDYQMKTWSLNNKDMGLDTLISMRNSQQRKLREYLEIQHPKELSPVIAVGYRTIKPENVVGKEM